MSLKKMLVIAPVMAQPADVASIARSLSFLEAFYSIDFIDPLTIMDDVSNDAYYQLWKQKLEKCLPQYDAFMGFSFGGVILQQCFSLFVACNKPIILCSTPTRADTALAKKLGDVVALCQENKLEMALNKLYDDVYFPDPKPLQSHNIANTEDAATRLIFGLTRVLNTDSTPIIQNSPVKYLHLIGERSSLVNANNVITSPGAHLVVVPGASMRVLESQLSCCEKFIMEALSDET